MRKQLLLSYATVLIFGSILFAQTTETFVVTDNPNRVFSCQDTLITLSDIYTRTGIRDLNDPNDNVSMYRMLRLEGAVITTDVIAGPIKYTDYQTLYVEKTGTPFNGHNGVVIYLGLLDPPARLFKKDSLKYTVEKGAKVNFSKDFFENFNFWSSGYDTDGLQERLFFIDEANDINVPIGNQGNYWTVGKGNFKVKVNVAVCGANDLKWDSIHVIVKETPCLHLEIKDMPSLCSDQIIDLRPYVFLDGARASQSQLAAMTFYDRSSVTNAASGAAFDAATMNMGTMLNSTDRSPNIEIAYQPNVALGVCTNYFYRPSTKIPTKFVFTNIVFTKDNGGAFKTLEIDGDYYGFNNTFNKSIFNSLYLNYYKIFEGTSFKFFTDEQLTAEATGPTLSPGAYKVLALNPACAEDSSVFNVNIKNRDFEIVWQSAVSQGKGYYTFTVPEYLDATYAWQVYGGSLVSGLNTREILVYFSPSFSQGITVNCHITLPAARLEADGSLHSGVYLDIKGDDEIVLGNLEETYATPAPTIYPNPATGSFAISGIGIYAVKIYDSLGKLVHQDAAYEAHSPIPLSTKGMHMVHMLQNGNTKALKVVVE